MGMRSLKRCQLLPSCTHVCGRYCWLTLDAQLQTQPGCRTQPRMQNALSGGCSRSGQRSAPGCTRAPAGSVQLPLHRCPGSSDLSGRGPESPCLAGWARGVSAWSAYLHAFPLLGLKHDRIWQNSWVWDLVRCLTQHASHTCLAVAMAAHVEEAPGLAIIQKTSRGHQASRRLDKQGRQCDLASCGHGCRAPEAEKQW